MHTIYLGVCCFVGCGRLMESVPGPRLERESISSRYVLQRPDLQGRLRVGHLRTAALRGLPPVSCAEAPGIARCRCLAQGPRSTLRPMHQDPCRSDDSKVPSRRLLGEDLILRASWMRSSGKEAHARAFTRQVPAVRCRQMAGMI